MKDKEDFVSNIAHFDCWNWGEFCLCVLTVRQKHERHLHVCFSLPMYNFSQKEWKWEVFHLEVVAYFMLEIEY
jgi:hypothetical protein